MKKQILILAMFTLAIMFAGTTKVFGQLLPGVTDPLGDNVPLPPLSCVSTADQPLHPYAGVDYIYSLTGDAGEETAANWTWWATKNPDFIPSVGTINEATQLTVATGDLNFASADYGIDNRGTANGTNSVTINWSSGILAGTEYQGDATAAGTAADPSPTFVVAYAEGVNCADNIQVYEIDPQTNFTIDIAPIDTITPAVMPWGDATLEYCVDDVQSALYNSVDHDLVMDYGQNVIYFEIAAANFVTDWTPTFQILQGLRTSQTAVISMHPTLVAAQGGSGALWTSAAIDATGMLTDIPTNTPLTATNVADIATGVSVYVRVVIDNATEESLTSNPFQLAVDAIDETGTGIWDMDDADCGVDPTTIVADQEDEAIITITPRPQLDHNTIDTNTASPNDRVPKAGDALYIRF